MNELNAEQIIKALECCKTPLASDCENCSYTGKRLEDGVYEGCVNCLVGDALALIKELTEENERLQKREESVAIVCKRAEEHYDTLYEQAKDILKAEVKADTVRKMQERLAVHFGTYTDKDMVKIREVFRLIDQIAKEMLEDTK